MAILRSPGCWLGAVPVVPISSRNPASSVSWTIAARNASTDDGRYEQTGLPGVHHLGERGEIGGHDRPRGCHRLERSESEALAVSVGRERHQVARGQGRGTSSTNPRKRTRSGGQTWSASASSSSRSAPAPAMSSVTGTPFSITAWRSAVDEGAVPFPLDQTRPGTPTTTSPSATPNEASIRGAGAARAQPSASIP